MSGAGQAVGAHDLFPRPIAGRGLRGAARRTRYVHTAVRRVIHHHKAVVAFRERTAPFVPQSHVDRQALGHLPVVLNVEARVARFVGCGRLRPDVAVAAPAKEERGDAVALVVIGIEDVHHRRGALERELPGRVVRLPEVIKEEPLSPPNFRLWPPITFVTEELIMYWVWPFTVSVQQDWPR